MLLVISSSCIGFIFLSIENSCWEEIKKPEIQKSFEVVCSNSFDLNGALFVTFFVFDLLVLNSNVEHISEEVGYDYCFGTSFNWVIPIFLSTFFMNVYFCILFFCEFTKKPFANTFMYTLKVIFVLAWSLILYIWSL